MAEYWGIEQEEAYIRLCSKTNIMDDYIIPNYPALSRMGEEDLAKEIENHFNGVVENDASDTREQD